MREAGGEPEQAAHVIAEKTASRLSLRRYVFRGIKDIVRGGYILLTYSQDEIGR